MVEVRTGEIPRRHSLLFRGIRATPTAVALGIYIEPASSEIVAGGFLVQSLPPIDEAVIEKIIFNIGQMPPVTEALRKGGSPESLLGSIFAGVPYHALEQGIFSKRLFLQPREE